MDRSVNEKIEKIHNLIINFTPQVGRVACVLWDESSDKLSTFVHSTKIGEPIESYQFSLKRSSSLSEISNSGKPRYIPDVEKSVSPGREHSNWLLGQGYKTSFTVPMYQGSRFIGFVFYNSCDVDAFNVATRQQLISYTNLIAAAISNIQTVIRLIKLIANLRNFEKENHLERVASYSYIIAAELVKCNEICDEHASNIFLFAPVHDVGKITVPDSILLKRDDLSEDEFNIMKCHVNNGLELIDNFNDLNLLPELSYNVLRNIVAHHHEKLDGSGYPSGLKADQISIEGQIVAIADIFDALTSSRPYKSAWTNEHALVELKLLADEEKVNGRYVDLLERFGDQVEMIQILYPDKD